MERQIPQPEPGAPGAEPRRGGLRTFASLRHRDYRYLWFGILFMSAGQWVQQVTLGWLVYELTRSATLLGALNGLRSLPFLVSGPLAGVAADRLDRRRLLMSTQAVLFVTAIVMGALVAGGQVEVWHLFVFTLITGVAWSINQPLRQAMMDRGLMPLGALAAGLLADQIGAVATVAIMGGLVVGLSLLVAWQVPQLRRFTM